MNKIFYLENNPNVIWIDTGEIKIHNYPTDRKNTLSYITRIYEEKTINDINSKYVEGNPIYFHQLDDYNLLLAKMIGEAQNLLVKNLPHNEILNELK